VRFCLGLIGSIHGWADRKGFKAGEGRLGSQDRSNPAPHVD
jgi:hypothetical protein